MYPTLKASRLATGAVLGLTWLLLGGCGRATPAPDQDAGPRGAQPGGAGGSPKVDTAEVKQLVAASNDLALRLLGRLAVGQKEPGNLAFSPYSIEEVMGLALLGAEGETRKELEKQLYQAMPREQLVGAFAALDMALGEDRSPRGGPRFGLRVEETPSGVKVVEVVAGSPAAAAGLKKDDVIVAIDHRPVKAKDDYLAALDQAGPVVLVETKFGANSTQTYRLRQAAAPPGRAPAPALVSLANAVWGQKGLAFKPEFIKEARGRFDAAVEELDFAADPKGSRQLINQWITHRTDGAVADGVGEDALTKDTALVLTNALCFKAAWESRFDPKVTRPGDFTTPAGKVQVPMMAQADTFKLFKGTDLQVLELGYEGTDVVMDVILPNDPKGLPALESKELTADNLALWLSRMQPRRTRLQLPRFKVGGTLNLESLQQQLGVTLAFGPKADFSGMTSQKDLHLSKVIQKAEVAVDEHGTLAAAATVASFKPKSAPEAEFVADHPFLFLLRDKRTNLILFVGRVVQPETLK